MLLVLALSAAAAELPRSLAAYDQAVTVVTGAVNTALPRFAACKPVAATKLVFEVDLVGVPAVTTATLSAKGAAAVSAPCHEKIVADVFTRARPPVGRSAAVVLDVSGATLRLDGDVALFGTLAKEAVEAGVRARMDRIAQCYVNALEDASGLTGEVVVGFTVLPNGQVLTTELKRTSLWNPPTEACVLAEVAKATFAEPEGGGIVRVTYPFTFEPPTK